MHHITLMIALQCVLNQALRCICILLLSLKKSNSFSLIPFAASCNLKHCVANFEPHTSLGSATILLNSANVLSSSLKLHFCRPYQTRVQLGNPPKNFTVLIDSGSNMPWISCETPGGPSVSVSHLYPQIILPLRTKCSL